MGRVIVVVACAGIIASAIVGACLDPDLRLIVTKADNVPILGLVVLLVFFTWLGLSQARRNDRLDDGEDRRRIYDDMIR